MLHKRSCLNVLSFKFLKTGNLLGAGYFNRTFFVCLNLKLVNFFLDINFTMIDLLQSLES